MSFFSRIFADRRPKSQVDAPKPKPEMLPDAPTAEYAQLLQFTQRLNSLLLEDRYLARSDYKQLIDEYADINTFFQNQKTATTLGLYCEKFAIPAASVEAFLRNYADLSDLREGSTGIQQHNHSFLQRHLETDKHYLDTVLSKVDPAISLDEEQRKVVLTDEDYMLVVAGAGAGKTTTVAAKVKYLVEKKGVKPEQILVISFTNKAVGELQDKINKALKINCPVTTFHKTGYAILRKQDADKKNVVDSGYMFDVINNSERFNALVGKTDSTKHYVVVTPDEVRASGLLKDRIVIRFPEMQNGGNAMAVLQAAADEWKDKWDHWTQYCQEQHYAYVLSTVLSGTPQQVVNLMSSVENGLFSRFLFYYLDKKTEWIDVLDEGDGEPLDEFFEKLGKEYLAFFHTLQELPEIKFQMTPEQGVAFNKHFALLQADYVGLFRMVLPWQRDTS